MTITNYFVLQPGEQRVQVHSAFCNQSDAEVTILAGELTDPGEGLEFFNGQACTNGFGFGGTCQGLDRMSWKGLLGTGVAYGYAPWTPGVPSRPGTANVTMTIAGITVTLGGVAGIDGLLQWFNQELGPAQRRDAASSPRLPGLGARLLHRHRARGALDPHREDARGGRSSATRRPARSGRRGRRAAGRRRG